MSHPQLAGIGAGISVPAAVISWVASELPLVQFIAAVIAIVSGAMSIWSWIRHR